MRGLGSALAAGCRGQQRPALGSGRRRRREGPRSARAATAGEGLEGAPAAAGTRTPSSRAVPAHGALAHAVPAQPCPHTVRGSAGVPALPRASRPRARLSSHGTVPVLPP